MQTIDTMTTPNNPLTYAGLLQDKLNPSIWNLIKDHVPENLTITDENKENRDSPLHGNLQFSLPAETFERLKCLAKEEKYQDEDIKIASNEAGVTIKVRGGESATNPHKKITICCIPETSSETETILYQILEDKQSYSFQFTSKEHKDKNENFTKHYIGLNKFADNSIRKTIQEKITSADGKETSPEVQGKGNQTEIERRTIEGNQHVYLLPLEGTYTEADIKTLLTYRQRMHSFFKVNNFAELTDLGYYSNTTDDGTSHQYIARLDRSAGSQNIEELTSIHEKILQKAVPSGEGNGGTIDTES